MPKMGCFCSQPKAGSDETKAQTEANRRINMEIQKDKHLYRSTHRLLLLGIYLLHLFFKFSFHKDYFKSFILVSKD